jgi:hypothetical protein
LYDGLGSHIRRRRLWLPGEYLLRADKVTAAFPSAKGIFLVNYGDDQEFDE